MSHSIFGPLFAIALSASSVACGGGGGGAGGSGGGASTSTSGSTVTSSSGTTTSASSTTSSSSGSSSSGQGGGSLASCNLPAVWGSCAPALQNGFGTCSEIDQPSGAFQAQCPPGDFHMGQSCPNDPNLFGVCKAGITIFYYSPPGAMTWVSLPNTCPAGGGTWCQVQ